MPDTIQRFTYSMTRMRLGDVLPMDPAVVLELDFGITSNSGLPAISPTLTLHEIDAEIEALKAGLDAVGRNAKAALRQALDDTPGMAPSRTARDNAE